MTLVSVCLSLVSVYRGGGQGDAVSLGAARAAPSLLPLPLHCQSVTLHCQSVKRMLCSGEEAGPDRICVLTSLDCVIEVERMRGNREFLLPWTGPAPATTDPQQHRAWILYCLAIYGPSVRKTRANVDGKR
jgi:hypothetical protein